MDIHSVSRLILNSPTLTKLPEFLPELVEFFAEIGKINGLDIRTIHATTGQLILI